ncbi:hypothetical protein [Sphingomonas morindae]|uniref:DUF4154 domain-containing protein n=1 Tax=Sphingomonas morindae TaxID=1541170 RepID=A0ABY4X4A4_9SPHN|nr:hypothetical protein [Sphingomonas morindae]USI71686.1 hypothetical protein LHA26_10130 [Sphingomonas morindae]
MTFNKVGIVALAASAVGAPCAAASFNLPVAARVIGFVQPPPSGVVLAGIVYEPGNAASEEEAALIEQQLAAMPAIGHATIKGRRVSAANLGGLAGTRVAFVTAGVRNQQQLGEWAAHNGLLTITSDLACVEAARCAVAVSSAARTQITVSRAAVKAAGLRFGSAFLMLVKEL